MGNPAEAESVRTAKDGAHLHGWFIPRTAFGGPENTVARRLMSMATPEICVGALAVNRIGCQNAACHLCLITVVLANRRCPYKKGLLDDTKAR